MSDDQRSSSSDEEPIHRQFKRLCLSNVAEGAGDVIQDQIIIVPEVMDKILKHLDLRNLKRVRLVCKNWFGEAQAHMENKGIVVLNEHSDPKRIKKFLKMRDKKISDLPQPFRLIDVTVGSQDSIILKWLIKQPDNLDCSTPLMIARFTPKGVPLKIVILLINQHSSTLEYLMLPLQSVEDEVPPLDPEQTFPNLRHINVETVNINFVTNAVSSYVSLIIAGIVKASPKLETYEFTNVSRNAISKLGSSLLMAVDIRNVKTLKLCPNGLRSAALLHLVSIPFYQLGNFELIFPSCWIFPWNHSVLTSILAKSATTLKTLNLSRYKAPERLAGFPICPTVQELTLKSFPYSYNFLSDRFPSLQVLNVNSVSVDVLGASWTDLLPISGLKTLTTKEGILLKSRYVNVVELSPIFLSKFPNLEQTRLNYSFVRYCCRKKAARDPQYSNVLGSVKHLELLGLDYDFWGGGVNEDYFSPLAALTGIETLTLVPFSRHLERIPFKDMRSLKVIRFPWGRYSYSNLEKLLANTKGLKKVVVTNCCSFPRTGGGDPLHIVTLQSFFDSAPNAECGCKDWKETAPEWD